MDKKCGYCGYILPKDFDLLKHSCFHPFNEDCHRLNIDENLTVTVVSFTNEVESNQQSNNLEDTDELLIYYVSQRRALFDHRIPASDRTTLKKNSLWQEVCNSLGGVLNVAEAKKRWRYLRDCFIKAKKKEHTYIPSGSAAEKLNQKRSSFRFYEQMKFLSNVLGKSETCTSLASNIQNNEYENIENSNEAIESSILESQPSCSNVSNTPLSSPVESGYFESSKKRKIDKQSRDEDLHEAVIAALQDTKKPDGIDGFLLLLSEGLRKLPYRERTKLQLKFLHMIMEEQEKLSELM